MSNRLIVRLAGCILDVVPFNRDGLDVSDVGISNYFGYPKRNFSGGES